MTLKIVKPEQQAYLKMLVFAPHKHGKTTLVASAQEDPRTSPSLLLDFEGNTECLVGLDIDIAPIREWRDFTEAYAFLANSDHKYKSVSIDSITEVNFYALSTEILRQGTSGKGREDGPLGPDQAQMQDFGRVLTQMRRLLRMFRNLPMHVMYTALDDTELEPGEGSVKIPAMIGQMKREVGALVSVVGYLSMQGEVGQAKKRVLLLHDIPRFRIGVRTEWRKWNSIPDTLEDPTITKLLDVCFPRPRVVAKEEAAS